MRCLRQMTALEELKESVKDSLFDRQRSVKEWGAASEEAFRDTILDLLSETVTMYKLTVAQARMSKDLEEIAALWKEAHDFYWNMQRLWRTLQAFSESKDELFLHWGRTIDKLERTTAEHDAFHAG
jgi:hypothetical protein